MSEPDPKIAPWEDVVLRIIAIYKFIKAALALVIGLTLLKLVHHDVSHFLHQYLIGPLHIDPDDDSESYFVKSLVWLVAQATNLTPHRIMLLSWANFFYAAVFAVEGVGLYLKKHWAEYMVLIVTGSFLPFEACLLYYRVEWWKVVLIVGNLAILVYLAHRIRLDRRAKARKKSEEALLPPATASAKSRQAVTEVR